MRLKRTLDKNTILLYNKTESSTSMEVEGSLIYKATSSIEDYYNLTLDSNLYLIRHPYSGDLIEPIEVNSIESSYDYNLLKEFPEILNNPSLDRYGVQVHYGDLFINEVSAYKEYIKRLKDHIKMILQI